MKAICLSGGYGTRLGTLTKNLPKPLIKIGGKTVLEHIIDRLNLHGIYQIIINTHYLPIQINDKLETRALYYHVNQLLGHEGTIYALKDWIKDDYFFVLNGDTISNINFTDMWNKREPDQIVQLMDGHRAAGVWLYPPAFLLKSDLPIKPYRPVDLIWHDIGTPERLKKAREYYGK